MRGSWNRVSYYASSLLYPKTKNKNRISLLLKIGSEEER